MSLALIPLLVVIAIGLTYVVSWALFHANHLDQNVMFLPWVRCTWRGKHRPVRHPLGGFRCLDCFLGGSAEDLGIDDGYVDTRRRTYNERRGA